MANIQDIADATGYSRTTVSKAFNNYTDISDKAKRVILETAREMGYLPSIQARGLKMKRSFTIGIILDELLGYGLSHPFFSNVVQSFRVAVENSGYSMIMISNHLHNNRQSSYISHCEQLNVDGVFILCTDSKDPGILDLVHSDIPTVLFDMPNEDTSCVMSDHYQGAYDAVKYLAGLGHKKIGHIYGTQLTYAGAERYKGFMDAMKDLDLPVNMKHLISGGYFDLKYGKKAMHQLLDTKELPTAVFASGDLMALGAAQVCDARGLQIPGDISIMGFDNLLMLDWIKPKLTTVAQDYDEIGAACCRILTGIIDKKNDEHSVVVIPTKIVERSSCAKL